MSPEALRRYRAERLLRKDFAGLRSKVLTIVRSQLRAKGVALDASDLEACYAQAWHGLYAIVLDGEMVENPSAWLVLVTFRRAIDESRSMSRIGIVEGEDMGSLPRRLVACANDLATELDDRTRLRHVFEGLRTRLSERECEAASLCYLQGLSRANAAKQIGISEARMRKLMEGAPGRPGVASKVAELLETIEVGSWCEQQSSLLRALAFGILDPAGERHAQAMAHCRECPACRARVASLRGLASVLPLPLLPRLALAGGAGTVSPGTRAAAGGHSWGGLVGSLTAKLAVVAVMTAGAGYALLGSRAHGSGAPGHPVAPSTAVPASSARLSRTPFSAFATPASRPRAGRRSSTAHARSSRPLFTRRSARKASSGEFSPERARREQAVAPFTSTHIPARTQSGSSHAAGEFGIE
jgi:DNA-directed RNA polymerase specialized sigma24 family protein